MRTPTALVGVLCVGLIAAAATPLHAAKYKIRWLLGHENLDYFEEAADSFKKAVEEGSRGEIHVDIMAKSHDTVGTIPEIAGRVLRGEAEMGHSFADVIGHADPRFWAFESPYLFRGYRHVEGFIEGSLGRETLAGLDAHGIEGLSFTFSGGASGIATIERELRRPEDLKGLKVGVYGNALDEAWLKALGAVAVPVGHSLDRLVAMARAGELDAVVITWRNFERAKLHTDFKYFNLEGSTFLVSTTYANAKFMGKLPARYQELIRSALAESSRIERAKTIELNEMAKRAMLAKGVRPVTLTETGRGRFAAALKPAYRGELARLLGADFLKQVQDVPDGPLPTVPSQELAGN